jgi:amino acid permease
MKNYTSIDFKIKKKRVKKSIIYAIIICIIVYFIVAIFGYLQFLENTKGNLLNSFSKTDFNMIFIGVFTLTIFLSIFYILKKKSLSTCFICL